MTIRVRSPHRRVTEAPTLAAAWRLVRAMPEHDSRAMLAMARRPDLTENYLTKMLRLNGTGHWRGAALRNPRVADSDQLHHFRRETDAIPTMVEDVEKFKDDLIACALYWDGTQRDQNLVDLAIATVGRDEVTRYIAKTLTGQDWHTIVSITRSRFFSAEHWPLALAAMHRAPWAEQTRLAEGLAVRTDASDEALTDIVATIAPLSAGDLRKYALMSFLNGVLRHRILPPVVMAQVPREWWDEIAHYQRRDNFALSFALAGHIPSIASAAGLRTHQPTLERHVMDCDTATLDADDLIASVQTLLRSEPSPEFVDWALRWWVRTYMLVNPATGDLREDRAGACEWLAEHAALDISRHHIAWVPVETWETTLDLLAEHDWPEARALAAARVDPADAADAFTDPSPTVRAAVAGIAGVSPDLLTAAANDPDPSVRAVVAARADAPQKTLTVLAYDTDAAVVATVAANPTADGDIITVIVNGPHPDAVVIASERFMDALAAPADR